MGAGVLRGLSPTSKAEAENGRFASRLLRFWAVGFFGEKQRRVIASFRGAHGVCFEEDGGDASRASRISRRFDDAAMWAVVE